MTQTSEPNAPDKSHHSVKPDAAGIYTSPASEPDDGFWLEQANKMIAESLPAVRTAASEMIKALAVLQGIYLGILGFAKFIPEDLSPTVKIIYTAPLLSWLGAIYQCIQVLLTESLTFNAHAPDEIRQKSTELIARKQSRLEIAYWCLFAGLVFAVILVIFRAKV